MKIDAGLSTNAAGAAQVGETAAASAVSGSKRGISRDAESGDTIELSGPLQILQTLAGDRAARIDRLTQAVQSGNYSVNAQKVSRALVQETLAGGAR